MWLLICGSNLQDAGKIPCGGGGGGGDYLALQNMMNSGGLDQEVMAQVEPV